MSDGVEWVNASDDCRGCIGVILKSLLPCLLNPCHNRSMKTKINKADAPLTRNEFKDAISKMTRNELIGILCDIYYANANDNAKDGKGVKGGKGGKGGCECDCGCGSEPKKSSKAPKAKVSNVSKKK